MDVGAHKRKATYCHSSNSRNLKFAYLGPAQDCTIKGVNIPAGSLLTDYAPSWSLPAPPQPGCPVPARPRSLPAKCRARRIAPASCNPAPATFSIYANWNANRDGIAGNDDPWEFGDNRQYPVLKYGGLAPSQQWQTFIQPDNWNAPVVGKLVTAGLHVEGNPAATWQW